MKPYIEGATVGGLGNQLFQLYFVHFLSSYSNLYVRVVEFERVSGLPYTRLILT